MVHMYMQYQIKGTILVKFTRARKIDHILSIIVKMYQQNIHLFLQIEFFLFLEIWK